MMEKRTLILFAVMLALFAFYAGMSYQTMPDLQSGLKAQTELLNNIDKGDAHRAGAD
jgi:hypothetical protein